MNDGLSPVLTGLGLGIALAVVLNPPAWVFLATAATSLMAAATAIGGTQLRRALAVVLAILGVGLALSGFLA